MTSTPALSIIILNYNSSEYTRNCLDSVLKTTTGISFEVIVVDNASEQEDYNQLREFIDELNSSQVQLIRSRINTGFGGGIMYAIQHARGKYYLCLNNDTLVSDGAIAMSLEFMEVHPDAGVCGARILEQNNRKEISFDHFASLAREIFGKKFVELLYSKPDRRKEYTEPLAVDFVNGSFMMFRAYDFNAVGGFDTNIFLYFEESDICYRLKKYGQKTYYLPQATYIHYQSQSLKKIVTKISNKLELKTSMVYVIRKNNGFFQYKVLLIFLALRYCLSTIIKPTYYKLAVRALHGFPLTKSMKQGVRIQDS